MILNDEHDAFRAMVRDYVEREINPRIDEWEAADTGLYRDPPRLVEVQQRHARAVDRLAKAEADWIALAETYETARVKA